MKIKIGIKVILCMIFILFCVSIVEANINVSGQTYCRYQPIKDSTAAGTNLTFTGKVNDFINGYTSLNIEIKSTDNSATFNYGSAFIIASSPQFGNLTFGYFPYPTQNLNILGGAYANLQSYTGLKYEITLARVVTFKLGYFPKEKNYSISDITNNISVIYNCYIIGFNYNYNIYNFETNYVRFDNLSTMVVNNNKFTTDSSIGYTINASIKPVDFLNAYVHYGLNLNNERKGILGATLGGSKFPVNIITEYNFVPNTNGTNSYGYRINLTLIKGIYMTYYNKINDPDIYNYFLFVASF